MVNQDPIAPHSAGISAYMSVHSATNLAYVRYFANQERAVSATFKSINASGFTVEYELIDGSKHDAFITFETPLTKREQIRPVLEAMAKEAEEALGMPSSLAGPPPIAAIAKSIYATATDAYTPPTSDVPLDTFYYPNGGLIVAITMGMGILYYYKGLSQAQANELPPALRQLYRVIPAHWYRPLWNVAAGLHVAEAVVAFGTCIHRGWYSTGNVLKWTISTGLFGFASMKKLRLHGRQVREGIKQD
ncbi:hypothetical protein INT43_006210 [Umbelopsis isabellina]|uniref:DUF2470 domain-containing protein n=1 Tax=Mortierella isabellina TaxID=91625 RepID=A0A8H7PZW0_MORIS|nr:hypothetical protein INT43_006210 [Umbelopsis isabellina]